MKDIRLVLIIPGLLILSNGCAVVSAPQTETTKTISETYQQAQKDTETVLNKELTVNKAFGYEKPYVPVINPPEVKRAWVLAHKTEDGSLIGGYWIYIIVKDASWYIETPQMNLPTITIPYKQESIGPKTGQQTQEEQPEKPDRQ